MKQNNSLSLKSRLERRGEGRGGEEKREGVQTRLRELGLALGSGGLVAVAARNLHVTVEAAHH